MRNRLLTALTALIALGLAACADAPTMPGTAASALGAPSAPVTSSLTTTAVTLTALLRTVPLASDVTYSATISASKGGKFDVPGTGLTVTVPAYAFKAKSMTITVTAPAGNMVAYEFGPHGTKFDKPLELAQSYKETNYESLLDKSGVEAGYFAETSDVNKTTKTVKVTEILSVTHDGSTSKLRFGVSHFSGYMLSSGRADD